MRRFQRELLMPVPLFQGSHQQRITKTHEQGVSMLIEEQNKKVGAQTRPTRTTSPRKLEANRRNAQRSTGPKTPEGKAKSSQNSVTHGIFVKKFLNGAAPETVAEIQAVAAGIQEHYQPVGKLEEILVQKIVIETARYHRVLGFEQEFIGSPMYVVACLDRMVRYTTSTSRALFRAIEELERIQAARKASESSDTSTIEESATPITQTKEDPQASQGSETALSDSSKPEGAVAEDDVPIYLAFRNASA
jgi:hypothetical protein